MARNQYYLSELTVKEKSKDISKDLEKNPHYFSYPLDTGFSMKNVNGYN